MGTRHDAAGPYWPTVKGILATFPRRPECGHIPCHGLDMCVVVEVGSDGQPLIGEVPC